MEGWNRRHVATHAVGGRRNWTCSLSCPVALMTLQAVSCIAGIVVPDTAMRIVTRRAAQPSARLLEAPRFLHADRLKSSDLRIVSPLVMNVHHVRQAMTTPAFLHLVNCRIGTGNQVQMAGCCQAAIGCGDMFAARSVAVLAGDVLTQIDYGELFNRP